ncbi:unnamed protein product [Symbiodinium sp. CCMP2592]|nr:unnamed protein product [Symbiodinium sp. CCMP2592]
MWLWQKLSRLGHTACLKQILVALPVDGSLTTHCSDDVSIWHCHVGWSLPHYAARDNPEMLGLLEMHGYNLSIADAHGWTPAHEEVHMMYKQPEQRLKFFRELAGRGARLDAPDDSGRTPAHVVCMQNESRVNVTAVLDTIYSSHGSLSAIDSHGSTPAHRCLQDPKAITFLHDVVPETFDVKNRQRRTPEQLAAFERAASLIVFGKLHALKCRRFDEEVGTSFDCAEESTRVPKGFAIMSKTDFCKAECAVKCPNRNACPGGVYPGRVCDDSYDAKSVGCSRCKSEYGRGNQDPFVCSKCRPSWQMWIVHVLKPVGIYVVSIRSAKANRDYQSVLLKMLLSFGTVASSIWPSVKNSGAYQHALPGVQLAADAGDASTSATTQWHGPSLDCLLGVPHAPMWQWLCLSTCVPFCLILVSVSIVCVGSLRAGVQFNLQLLHKLMKPYAIFINCFLPDLLGAVVRYVPCMHFQEGDRARFAIYDVTSACPWELYRYTILVAAVLLGAVVGPVLWAAVIKRSSTWQPEERREVVGFLTSGYQEAWEWWEAGVLTRKCLLLMAASLFPMSYCPFLFLTSLLVIMGTSLTLHALAWPYCSVVLNQLELAVLTSSTIAILCAMVLTLQQIEWTLDNSITFPALATALLLLQSPFIVLVSLLLYEVRNKGAMIQSGFRTFSEQCCVRESNAIT